MLYTYKKLAQQETFDIFPQNFYVWFFPSFILFKKGKKGYNTVEQRKIFNYFSEKPGDWQREETTVLYRL